MHLINGMLSLGLNPLECLMINLGFIASVTGSLGAYLLIAD